MLVAAMLNIAIVDLNPIGMRQGTIIINKVTVLPLIYLCLFNYLLHLFCTVLVDLNPRHETSVSNLSRFVTCGMLSRLNLSIVEL